MFLLNSPFGPDAVWDQLPADVQEQIVGKQLRALRDRCVCSRRASGMGGRINTVMQTCFFAFSGVLPRDEAIAAIKRAIEKTYGKAATSRRANNAAVDATLARLHEMAVPRAALRRLGRLRLLVPTRRLASCSASPR